MRSKKFHQGKFKPKNPSKYVGDVNNIIYRSSWELKMFVFCDLNTGIARWSSEEIVIPYISPLDNKPHRYFPDLYIEIYKKNLKDYDENAKGVDKFIVEIKPEKQSVYKKPKRMTKSSVENALEIAKNHAKWEACQVFCARNGMKFMVLTEKSLFVKK